LALQLIDSYDHGGKSHFGVVIMKFKATWHIEQDKWLPILKR